MPAAAQAAAYPGDTDSLRTSLRIRLYNRGVDQIVFEVKESLEGGFEASALGYRIHTQGEDWDDLKLMIRDAVRCHFEEDSRPHLIRIRSEEVLSA